MRPVPSTVARVLAAVTTASLVSGCSWSRFDDLAEDAPIVLLKKPDDIRTGFGSNLATARLDEEQHLLVGAPAGNTGAATFFLGTGEDPVKDALSSGHCAPNNDPCLLGRRVAGLGRARGNNSTDDLELCFAAGFGSTGSFDAGILTRCADGTEFAYPLPSTDLQTAVDGGLSRQSNPPLVALGSDAAEAPALIAGLASEQSAWFYSPLTIQPRLLPSPITPPDESYGETVAVARIGDERLLLVGAPGEGHVWLFRTAADGTSAPVGCLGGPTGFGRALTTGRIDDDENDEVVIADETNVTVFDGSALATLVPTTSPACSLASLPQGGLVASFGCGTVPDVEGCAGSRFGAAVAVGDLDGDGDGEVVVGAPDLSVRGESRGGAVLVYDVEDDAPYALAEVQFISSAEAGDRLGEAVATPRIEGRHIIAAGAPGNAKVALFYCSRLLGGDVATSRCR